MSTDIGENCTNCKQSVKWGSGFYVNRIPASNGIVNGYLCSACQHDGDDDECNCDGCMEDTSDTQIEGRFIRLSLEDIGEGYSGDYDPSNPDDVALLRLDCLIRTSTYPDGEETDDPEWRYPDGGSVCTLIPVAATKSQRRRFLTKALTLIEDYIEQGGDGVWTPMARASWFTVDDDLVCERCNDTIPPKTDERSALGGDIICQGCKEEEESTEQDAVGWYWRRFFEDVQGLRRILGVLAADESSTVD